MFVQCGVSLTGAENDAIDFGRVGDRFGMFGIRNDPLEVRFASEIFDRGAG